MKNEEKYSSAPNPLLEDERLKNVEPRMIEIILNEVLLDEIKRKSKFIIVYF